MSANMITPEQNRRAAGVNVVLMDVDGVLTDGSLWVDDEADRLRRFHARDGLGIRLGQRAGIRFGLISGRESAAVRRRAAELDIEEIHLGIRDKAACFQEIASRLQIDAAATCFIGDDLIDLPVMREVGFTAAPADAVAEVRERVDFVTLAPGGSGAVREVVELLLHSSGRWRTAVAEFIE
jgi:3-deoxy-D-manno-octulosonate 8-phosphate phosphatase (KDO 8-P phosphatase)